MPLSNAQYDSIMRMYGERRASSRREFDERLARIHAEIPELDAIESEIVSCQADKVRSAVSGRGADPSERLNDLRAKRSALLISHGYSGEAPAPSYICPDCRDTGFVDGGKCHCFIQAEIDLLYRQSEIKDILKKENFSTFSYEWYDGGDLKLMRQIVADAKLFIENFDTSFQNLLLMGHVGTGKTFLSNCIAKELIDSCHSVIYLTAFRLFEVLSNTAFGGRESSDDDSYIFDCDLLIIDDLGTELANSFTVSRLFLCINERILHGKSTLISTNLDMEGLRSVYTERTLSRIISSYTIRRLPGSDIRVKKQLRDVSRA